MDSDFAPRVSPGELRPNRWWYAVAGGIALLGLCAGVTLAGLGFWSLRSELPQMRAVFSDGQPATVTLSKSKPSAIYVRVPQSDTTLPSFKSTCTGKALDGGSFAVSRPEYNLNTGANGGGDTWRVEHKITVSQSGKYQITCEPINRSDAPDEVTYGIGPAPRFGSIFGKIFGTVGALLGGPCCGLLVGGVIALVVGLRRNTHKNRLAAERSGMAYPPGPLGPPGPVGPPGPDSPPEQTAPDQETPGPMPQHREPPHQPPPGPPDA